MLQQAYLLLAEVQELHLTKKRPIESFVWLHCYAVDLDFDLGQKVTLFLLRKNKASLAAGIKNLPKWMGRFSDQALELAGKLISHEELRKPINIAELPQQKTKKKFMTIPETMVKLLRDESSGGSSSSSTSGAPFHVRVRGCPSRRVHAFVLYSRWPFFRKMFDSGFKEKESRLLELPNQNEEGGMHPDVLEIILEFAYTGRLEKAEKRVDHAVATQILHVADLYLDNYGDGDNPFTPLIRLAQRQATGESLAEDFVFV